MKLLHLTLLLIAIVNITTAKQKKCTGSNKPEHQQDQPNPVWSSLSREDFEAPWFLKTYMFGAKYVIAEGIKSGQYPNTTEFPIAETPDRQYTEKLVEKDGITYKFFVHSQETSNYKIFSIMIYMNVHYKFSTEEITVTWYDLQVSRDDDRVPYLDIDVSEIDRNPELRATITAQIAELAGRYKSQYALYLFQNKIIPGSDQDSGPVTFSLKEVANLKSQVRSTVTYYQVNVTLQKSTGEEASLWFSTLMMDWNWQYQDILITFTKESIMISEADIDVAVLRRYPEIRIALDTQMEKVTSLYNKHIVNYYNSIETGSSEQPQTPVKLTATKVLQFVMEANSDMNYYTFTLALEKSTGGLATFQFRWPVPGSEWVWTYTDDKITFKRDDSAPKRFTESEWRDLSPHELANPDPETVETYMFGVRSIIAEGVKAGHYPSTADFSVKKLSEINVGKVTVDNGINYSFYNFRMSESTSTRTTSIWAQFTVRYEPSSGKRTIVSSWSGYEQTESIDVKELKNNKNLQDILTSQVAKVPGLYAQYYALYLYDNRITWELEFNVTPPEFTVKEVLSITRYAEEGWEKFRFDVILEKSTGGEGGLSFVIPGEDSQWVYEDDKLRFTLERDRLY